MKPIAIKIPTFGKPFASQKLNFPFDVEANSYFFNQFLIQFLVVKVEINSLFLTSSRLVNYVKREGKKIFFNFEIFTTYFICAKNIGKSINIRVLKRMNWAIKIMQISRYILIFAPALKKPQNRYYSLIWNYDH